MQSIIRCSIPLHESVYLLFLPQISLHIYHMIYGPMGQRQVSWAYNLHYVWDLITHPCPKCILLAILRVLDKQFTLTSGLIQSVTSLLIASFHDNGGIGEYQAHQESSEEDLCVLGMLCPFRLKSPATEVTPLRVMAGHHTNGARRAETVIMFQPDSWRFSCNYGYLASRQRRNGPRR